MSQFDLETDAALAQINFEELSTTPGGEFVEIIADLLKLVGGSGPLGITGGISNLVLKVRKLAGSSYASNLVFTITAVRNDLATLYHQDEKLRVRIDSLPDDPRFAEAISALALRAMHTSVRDRLKRLARLVANGVKEDDLEIESLDDMLRAAAELKDADIVLLKMIYDKQAGLIRDGHYLSSEWSQQVAANWSMHFAHLDGQRHLETRGSLTRLQSAGFIVAVETMMVRNGSISHQPFGLVREGAKFYGRLQEISKQP